MTVSWRRSGWRLAIGRAAVEAFDAKTSPHSPQYLAKPRTGAEQEGHRRSIADPHFAQLEARTEM